jgi:hypothetical protein
MLFRILAVIVFAAPVFAQPPPDTTAPPPPQPPGELSVEDAPDDQGGVLIVNWALSPDDASIASYQVWRAVSVDGTFEMVAELATGQTSHVDEGLSDDTTYSYRVRAVDAFGGVADTEPASARPGGNWWHRGRSPVFVGLIVITGFIVWFITHAKRGKDLYIRPIAGIDAVDEAIGRATEMGKPILFVNGLSSISDVATIAGLTVLSRVAKKTAEYQTDLIVPSYDPIVFTVQQEVVKEAYLDAGRPDAYHDDMVFFVTDSQFPYVAAVNGIMLRDRPATNFYMGMFYAESLILAETGNIAGSIQIAGTDAVTQLPFFITACDYTLIGEEFYAASAYLSREPVLLGSIKGQDFAKAIVMVFVLIGGVAATTAMFLDSGSSIARILRGIIDLLAVG